MAAHNVLQKFELGAVQKRKLVYIALSAIEFAHFVLPNWGKDVSVINHEWYLLLYYKNILHISENIYY